ncbi:MULTISPECIES: hypothetical protein [Moorena]|uniref:Secreted protein n=1 Tax=Moorena bouillonii PNG TaxID=568701 RepID=A0A1U7MZY9_9CYAN|nr:MULTISPECIES: hypothetical protein [Moorena]NEO49385.1 hypothetical protein [Moorena sp. SIO4A3]NEO16188.1 hypothetical protein [Moorena sp. SIO3E8]NEP27556.1 hypothetical protein [Moorena sp. SIO3I6]NEQ02717.1 hypothetical protein [Moorena sp. SIO3F7]OLT59275.1 hypothetical protein BJP37_09705 [Moorena bouillonii PNG]
MKTIKTSLSKVLTLAVVALTVLFSFAVNPGVAQADGYCCGGDVTYLQNPQEHFCLVEAAPGYEYEAAILHNESPEEAVVIDASTGEPTFIPPFGDNILRLPQYSVFYLVEGNGPVDFHCVQ